MKTMSIENIRIHCDSCEHEFSGNPEEWHLKSCPECSAPNIITDNDLSIFRSLFSVASLVNSLCGEAPDNATTVAIKINTAGQAHG